jgi:hypothetical protein
MCIRITYSSDKTTKDTVPISLINGCEFDGA